ncbi:MAG TPA: TonB-dependent receptor, partial [Longimicrobiales bacterium]|nr:TonB-dependent receptor [Longimicrobiales bacterium]
VCWGRVGGKRFWAVWKELFEKKRAGGLVLYIAVNTSYRKRSSRFIPDGNLANGFTLNVMRGPANNFKRPGACSTPEMVCTSNAEVLDQVSMARTDHFVTGFTMRWEPTPRMSHRLTLGYDYLRIENSYELPFGFLRAPLGQISINDQQHTTLSIDYVGSVRHDLGGLASTFWWGGQLFEDRDNYVSAVGRDFSGPGEPTLTSGAVTEVSTHSRLRVVNAGFFFQEMLGWRDRLFITAGLRVDGNSAFGENFGLQPYPKLSAAYVISDHEWWPSSIEAMKLRAAVGESGKAPGAFDAVRTWEPIAADDGKPGFTPAQLGNPDLGPERTREFEVGFEASAFEGRIGIDYTYYRQRTMDALIGMLAPPSQGFLNRQLMNVGTIDNRGHELRLDGAILRTPTAEWRARLNISTNDSKAVDLGGEDIPVGSGNYVREGYPVPSFFGIKILNPDEIAEPILSEETYIGPSYPTRIIGFGTTISLFEDRLVLDLLAEHQGGHYNANFVGYQNNLRGVWRPCYEINAKLRAFNAGDQSALNDVTARERARCAIDREKMHSDFWISPADFTKLRTVSLTYRLPPRLVPGARTAMLTLSGRNLFTWTDYDGVDPEVADMSDSSFGRREYYNLPPLRSFLASIRVTF